MFPYKQQKIERLPERPVRELFSRRILIPPIQNKFEESSSRIQYRHPVLFVFRFIEFPVCQIKPLHYH